MKKSKKLLACILAVVLCLTQLMFLPSAKSSGMGITASAAPLSGACGDNLVWDLSLITGTLTISGSGDMTNWDIVRNKAPWYPSAAVIRKVNFEGSVTSIGDYAFAYCEHIESITIPDSVTYIGKEAFYRCYDLTNVMIGKGVSSIGENAFKECKKLICITVDEDNENYAGFDCVLFEKTDGKLVKLLQYPAGNSRTSYSIPDTVEAIADCAFLYAVKLTSIVILASVKTIGTHAFFDCIGMKNYSVAEGNESFKSEDGVLFNKDKTELIQYPAGNERESYEIPDSVKIIGYTSFRRAKNLANVTIPNSVTEIKAYAFSVCEKITKVAIPDSVTVIGEYAFAYSGRLTFVTIGNGVTDIGIRAFQDCESLVEVNVPESVTTIKERTFDGCKNLMTVTIPASVTSIEFCAFDYCYNLRSVYYGGSAEQWDEIEIDKFNLALKDAVIYYSAKTENGSIIVTAEEQTVYYRFTRTLRMNAKNIPEDAAITWSGSGLPIKLKPSTNGRICDVKFLELGDVTISAKTVDENGNQIIFNYNFNVKYTWWQWIFYILLGFRFFI